MKLTVGMATIEDYDGVYFTLQSFRMYHEPILRSLGCDVEYIVVDNKPNSRSSPHVKRLVEYWIKGRYIEMPRPEGTTQSRNRVFAEATGDVVMCVDSHILLFPGAAVSLYQYYKENKHSMDLLSGPLMVDDLQTPNTHFDNMWRSEMWGIWGRAWECKGFRELDDDAGTVACRLHFSVMPTEKGNWPHRLEMAARPFYSHDGHATCPRCGTSLPKDLTPQALKEAGYIDLAFTNTPFEVPGQGLGLFACRKDAWLGFNEHFTGFGGEELYIHEKFRQAGKKALCLPNLKWAHRFGRPMGHPYNPTRHQKVRNYILGLQELGLSLEPLKQHFVGGNLLPEAVWEAMIRDPLELTHLKLIPPPPDKSLPQPRASLATVEEYLAWVKEIPRDLDQHVDKIAELAAQCDVATEVTHRRESTVALLPAKKVISFNAEQDDLLLKLPTVFPNKLHSMYRPLDKPIPRLPEETDLLFIDTVHTAERLYYELKNYSPQVRRWIVMHDTQLHAENGEEINGKKTPGMLPALRLFMKEHPEWSVLYHTDKQYGLTVIGKLDQDKPKLPGVITLAANFTKAMADYVADGAKNVSKEAYNQRLEICTICDQRSNNRCAVCGCGLAAKASMQSSICPLGKWPDTSPKESTPQG